MRSDNTNAPALLESALITGADVLAHGPRGGFTSLEEVLARSRQARERAQALLGRGKKTILVVEDRDMEREGLATVLRREGYNVLTAANGQQALEQFVGEPCPDLVLLDMLLAGIDGWDILQIRKRSPAMMRIPVIIVSGLSHATHESIQAHGVAEYLHKPVEIPTLLEAVHRYC